MIDPESEFRDAVPLTDGMRRDAGKLIAVSAIKVIIVAVAVLGLSIIGHGIAHVAAGLGSVQGMP